MARRPLPKIHRLGQAALLAALLATALPTLAAPLPTVVAKVLEQHPDVRSARALMRSADTVITQARSEFFPTVSLENTDNASHEKLSGATSYVNSRIHRSEAVARWNLFNGYADYFGTRSAQHAREAAEMDLEETREAVTLRLTEIYLEVLRLTEQQRNAQAYVDELTSLVRDVELRANAGRIPTVEAEQANSRLIRARFELSQQRAQLAAARNAFRQLTGQPAEDLSEPSLTSDLADLPLDELLARSEELSPRVRAARQRIQVKDADVQAGRAEYFPKLTLESRKRISTAPDTALQTDTAHSNILQLSLSVPLGGKNLARNDELVEKKFAAQADADSRLLDVRSNVGEQQASLIEARAMAPELRKQLATAARVVTAYRLLFDAGRRSLLDLLTVREDLYQAQSLENANRHGQIVTAARLAKQVGTLRQALGGPAAQP